MPGSDPLASINLVFGADAQDVRDATVYLRLEEAGRVDAPSRIVAEQVLRGVAWEAGKPLHLELRGDVPPSSGSYQLRVHVDVDGDGQVSAGDYVSTESYPVNPSAGPAHLGVRVHRV
ncbi:MAG TPA: hypothetical protein VHK24_10460 [Steroidobacter sp.]|nr:hypothetical protein [Steroidobacter sp.]